MTVKKNVTLIKIRTEDGAQCYRFGPGLNDVIWLCGSDRAQKATVGDKGNLVYDLWGNRGKWTFCIYES